jgi:hypothetical protein
LRSAWRDLQAGPEGGDAQGCRAVGQSSHGSAVPCAQGVVFPTR